MKHEHRSNWIRHHGGRRSPAASDRWGHERPGRRQCARGLRRKLTVQRATKEVGLTLVPPPRYRSSSCRWTANRSGSTLCRSPWDGERDGAEVRVMHVHCPLQAAYRPETLYYDRGLDAWLRRRRQAYLNGPRPASREGQLRAGDAGLVAGTGGRRFAL